MFKALTPTERIRNAKNISEISSILDEVTTQELGRTNYVVTGKGDEVKTAFKLVEASELVISNTLDGRINEAYPQELQPRDRTRKSSMLQITKIAADPRPAQLTASGLSSHGAPIVGQDMVVESGNGRSLALTKSYAEGNAEKYRAYLLEHASEYGVNPEQVKKMNSPILVRVRLTDVDRAVFAKDSNLADLQQMSPMETARVDAERIDDRLMSLFNPSDSGDLMAASNRPFVQAFLAAIGSEQAAGLVTRDGRPTKQAIDRMQAALFAKAYRNESLLELAVEEPDPEIRNVITALNTAAAEFVTMNSLSGEAHKQTVDSIAEGTELTKTLDKEALTALVDAAEIVRLTRASGQSVDEYLAQQGLFGDTDPDAASLALFISQNNRSAKRMGDAFKLLAQGINDELQRQGQAIGDMFGGGELQLPDVLAQVNQQLEMEYGEGVSIQQGMFEDSRMEAINRQAEQAATSPTNPTRQPTDGQKYAGNYKKGHVKLCGFEVAIENPRGSVRSGTDPNGTDWAIELKNHYGDIKGTTGADGDPLDVFIGYTVDPEFVYVVDQVDPNTREFDEHKVMLGFDSIQDARKAYYSNYEEGWKGLQTIERFSREQFTNWVSNGDLTKPASEWFTSSMMFENTSPVMKEMVDRLISQASTFGDLFKAFDVATAKGDSKTDEGLDHGFMVATALFKQVFDSTLFMGERKGLLDTRLEAVQDELEARFNLDYGYELDMRNDADAMARQIFGNEKASSTWLDFVLAYPDLFERLARNVYILENADTFTASQFKQAKDAFDEVVAHRPSIDMIIHFANRPNFTREDIQRLSDIEINPLDYRDSASGAAIHFGNQVLPADEMTSMIEKAFDGVEISTSLDVALKQLNYNTRNTWDSRFNDLIEREEESSADLLNAMNREIAEVPMGENELSTRMEIRRVHSERRSEMRDQIAQELKELADTVVKERIEQVQESGHFTVSDLPYFMAKDIVKGIKRTYAKVGRQVQEKINSELLSTSRIDQWGGKVLAEAVDMKPSAWKKLNKKMKAGIHDMMGDLYHLASGEIGTLNNLFYNGNRQSAYRSGWINVGKGLDKVVLWHEMGHHIEYSNPHILDAARELMLDRYKKHGESIRPLNELSLANYKSDERAIDDGFIDYYVGKVYRGKSIENVDSTEVVSMGVQYLASPELIGQLAAADPQHLTFTLGLLRGLGITPQGIDND